MKIPFVDLEIQYNSIKDEVLDAIEKVIDSRKFIQGDFCKDFSNNFLEVHGGNFGTGCSNGTSAISLSLRAIGVQAGDEVITVANTFFATLEAIVEVGAIPVLVDCSEKDYLININLIKEKITPKTTAIIPVHLYGNPVAMNELMTIANEHSLKVVEDCAQAHLGSMNGQAMGTFGDAGTFSFYPGKNLGAYGDAGFVISKAEKTHNLVSKHLDHGRTTKYEHDLMAGNYRMDAIQAAVLNVKLKYISDWTDNRIQAAAYYDTTLKENGFKVIDVDAGAKCVYHLYIVEVSNREEVMSSLKEKGISTGIHYPIPMHLQPACHYLGYKRGDFPVSERTADRIMSLPVFPEITREQQDYILKNFLEIAKR
jgi:dTDP-4-amino-4,6-dideoxygalactose transaminase